MKGLIVSLITLALYVLGTMITSHLFRPTRRFPLFVLGFAVFSPVYFLLYALTPADLFCLPDAWQCRTVWLDSLYGYAVFFLNSHSYIDFFFAFNGGFSMCLLLEILRAGDAGCNVEKLLHGFQRDGGDDKIYGRRLPNMERWGWITIDRQAGRCQATPRGRLIANIDMFFKRFLNLGAGG